MMMHHKKKPSSPLNLLRNSDAAIRQTDTHASFSSAFASPSATLPAQPPKLLVVVQPCYHQRALVVVLLFAPVDARQQPILFQVPDSVLYRYPQSAHLSVINLL